MFPLANGQGVPPPTVLSVASVQAFLDELPPAVRARLRWTPDSVRILLAPLAEVAGAEELDAIEIELATKLSELTTGLLTDLVGALDGEMLLLGTEMVRRLPAEMSKLRKAAESRLEPDAWLALEWAASVFVDASIELGSSSPSSRRDYTKLQPG